MSYSDDEIMPYVEKCMHLEVIIVSKTSYTEEEWCVSPHIQNLDFRKRLERRSEII